MAKVGILTYHFSDNYGALMQAYALREWFIRRGHDASFINYHPRYVEEGGAFDTPLDPRKWRKNAAILYMKLRHLRSRVLGNRTQRQAFEAFRHDVLGIGGQPLEIASALAGIKPYDLLVCGSDQIWSPSIQGGLDPVYFLTFPGAERARRISYAPSFGRSTFDPKFHSEAGRLIGGLDGVSVREASGVEIIRAVAGRGAACVPDPTLLLNDFSLLLPPDGVGSRGHIFCYALRSGEVIRPVAEAAAAKFNAPILSPHNPDRRWSEIGATIYPSPAQWLGYLADAAFVVSNSFHGVALSIVLKKPFVAVTLPSSKRGLSERVVNLLRQLGLEDRLVSEEDIDRLPAVLAQHIDWSAVELAHRNYIRAGEGYLTAELAHLEVPRTSHA